MAPPDFLRRVPWWLLWFINRHTRTCWAHMVLWKQFGDVETWSMSETCWDGSTDYKYDFCGRYETEAEFRKAMRQNTP